MIEVAHISMYNPDSAQVEILRVCSSPHFIANGHFYLPYLAAGLDFNVSLFDRGTTEGSVTVGVGTIVINNPNGELDALRKYGFDGRSISIYKPKDKDDGITDSTNIFFSGTILFAEFGWHQITLHVKSKLEDLSIVMQPAAFAGTNIGTGGAGGYEGSADNAAKVKPQVFGRVTNVTPALINQFYLMYAFNFDTSGNFLPLYQIYNVYVKGIRYVWNTVDYATPALLQAAVIAAGNYATCLGCGMMRLGSVPASNGDVVADVADAPDSACTVAQVVARIFERNTAYVAGTDYDSVGLAYLDQVDSTPAGYYVNTNVSKADVINQLLDSIGAWFAPNVAGLYKFGYIDLADTLAQTNVPVCVITKQQWGDDIERASTEDQSQNVPAYAITVQHTRNWTPQESGSLADAVGTAARALFTKEWQSVKKTNDAVLVAHPLAPSLTYETLLLSNLYLPLLNGDFSVPVTALNNGWTVAGATISTNSSAGKVTVIPNAAVVTLAQALTYKTGVFPGTIQVGFTVPAGAGSFVFTVSRNQFAPVTLYTETFVMGAADVQIVRSFTLDDGLSLINGLTAIQFTTINTTTSFAVANVYVRMIQQGAGPDGIANRRLSINSSLQERYIVPVPQNFYLENGIDIGKMVVLQDDVRFGLQNGLPFLVIGADPSEDDYRVTLDVWRAG